MAIVLLKKGPGQPVISDTLRQLIESRDYSAGWIGTDRLPNVKKQRGGAGARRAGRSRSPKK